MTPAPAPAGGGFLPPGPMDYSVTGIGWLDYGIDLLVVVGLFALAVGGFYFRHIAPKLAEIARYAKTSASQTANSHADAEHPNLRDDLDAKFEVVGKQLTAVSEKQETIFQMLAQMQAAQNSDREAMRTVERKLEGHIDAKKDYGARLETLERAQKGGS